MIHLLTTGDKYLCGRDADSGISTPHVRYVTCIECAAKLESQRGWKQTHVHSFLSKESDDEDGQAWHRDDTVGIMVLIICVLIALVILFLKHGI